MVQRRKLRRRNNTGSANKGYGVKGGKKPQRNPTHTRSSKNRGTEKNEKGRVKCEKYKQAQAVISV